MICPDEFKNQNLSHQGRHFWEVQNFDSKLQKCDRTSTNAIIHDMLWWIQKSKSFPPKLKFSKGQKSWFKTAKMWGNKCKCNTLWYAPMNSKIQIIPTEVEILKKWKNCYTKLQKCERTNTNATIHDMLQWIKKSKYFPPNLRLLRSTKKLIQNCKNVKEKVKMQHSIIYYDEFEKSKNSQQSAKH